MIELLSHHPLIAAPLALLLPGLLCTALLVRTARHNDDAGEALTDRIDALLPQSQCGLCGYPGCRPYADAIASGEPINRCLPGGDATIRELAELLDVAPLLLDTGGIEPPPPSVAWIREADCIGCTKCIQACPVDAILGAAKRMHTVIASECTGCDLCVEPCPVDCIEMHPLETTLQNWHWPSPEPLIATDREATA